MDQHKLFPGFELDWYRRVAEALDAILDDMFEWCESDYGVADQSDCPLEIEHLLGVGLATAQVYLLAIIREHGAVKKEAFDVGPCHESVPVARLTNHGANFWKHADEWDWDVPDKRRDETLSAFSDVGIADDELPLEELLRKLTGQSRQLLSSLFRSMNEWHIALAEAHPRT